MDYSFGNQLKDLQKLLYPKDSSDDSSDDDLAAVRRRKMGPADLGPKSDKGKPQDEEEDKNEMKNKELPPELQAEEKTESDAWLEKQFKEDEEILDTRKRPNYRISYKQAVGTEDLYLGMNCRTPGSMSCEDMVIEIEMPDETVSVDVMDLEVTENNIDLKTALYRLKLPLIHPIDPDRGTAKFDTDKKCLILTLRMKREYDFAHF